mmetsp:Transcript_21414/g.49347  ORF Transcript_21414/g.49347 Transcript_21414/m.49347 type:complete len:212 (+) Transcript_21414:1036-1671(+)
MDGQGCDLAQAVAVHVPRQRMFRTARASLVNFEDVSLSGAYQNLVPDVTDRPHGDAPLVPELDTDARAPVVILVLVLGSESRSRNAADPIRPVHILGPQSVQVRVPYDHHAIITPRDHLRLVLNLAPVAKSVALHRRERLHAVRVRTNAHFRAGAVLPQVDRAITLAGDGILAQVGAATDLLAGRLFAEDSLLRFELARALGNRVNFEDLV